MKTIIAGSRTLCGPKMFNDAILQCPWAITEVVSGGARGIDTLGEAWARKVGVPVKRFPVSSMEWRTIGKSAGIRRNEKMARYAEALFAIWDGVSPGTKHMIGFATDMGLRVHVVQFRKIGNVH